MVKVKYSSSILKVHKHPKMIKPHFYRLGSKITADTHLKEIFSYLFVFSLFGTCQHVNR